jgi:hypothetical protein
MSKNLIPNFDKKIKKTKGQLKILDNLRKCNKVIYYLYLETRGITTSNYGAYIRDFFIEINENNIDEYLKDPRIMEKKEKIKYLDNIENDIKKFNKSLENKSGSYRKSNLSALRELLKKNKIDLGNHFWKNVRKNGNKVSRQTETETPTKEQLKKILSNADIEARAIFLTQMSSGSRLGSIITLELNDLYLDKTPPQIRLINEKNGKPITKFISTEAKEYIDKYKEIREKLLKTRLNRTYYIKNDEDKLNELKERYEKLVFPMSESNVEIIWGNLLRKENLYKLDPRTNKNPMGTHSLIRYFEDNIGNGKLSRYLRNKLTKSEEPYQYKTKHKLYEEYLNYEKNLYVFKYDTKTEEEIDEVKDELNKTEGKLKITIDKLKIYEDKNKELDKKYDNVMDLLKDIKHREQNPFTDYKPTEEVIKLDEEEIKKAHDKELWKLEQKLKENPERYKDYEITDNKDLPLTIMKRKDIKRSKREEFEIIKNKRIRWKQREEKHKQISEEYLKELDEIDGNLPMKEYRLKEQELNKKYDKQYEELSKY